MNIKTFVGSILVLLIFIVPAYSQAIKNAVPDVARPLPLSSVRITGGPLKRAQDLNADYLLKLEPDRMMAYYRKRAGLEPRAEGYPGWDGDGKNLTGHIAGHYLSGVSLMFAATGDPRFKQRADYIVKEMKEVQDKNGDGYLGAVERALFNHILGSIDPEDGRTCYMVPVGRGVNREYQEMFSDFTCCVGTGMESHGLHGDGIYYESGDRLWINMYVPSTASWKEAGATVAMQTTFPDGDAATLKITLQKPKTFTLFLRRPSWAGDGFTVKVNGQSETALPGPGSYVELKRTWKTGDSVSLMLPKALHIEGLADNPERAALMWGPLVLAGNLGPERRGPTEPVPGLVTDEKPVTEWLQPVPDSLGVFRTAGVGRNTADQAQEVEFSPFYRLHRRTYAVYFDLYNRDEWSKKIEELTAERTKQQKLEAATVAFLQPGEPEREKAFNQQGEETVVADRVLGRAGRRARKWFSFDLPVEPGTPMMLVVTYNPEERSKRTFEILVDGQRVGEGMIERFLPGSPTGRFYDLDYKIPPELVKEKKKVTVRVQATAGNETATVFGIRIVRDER